MARKKKWSELSGGQRFGVVVGAIVQIALQAAALRDLKKRPADQVNGPKVAWVLGSFVNTLGPIAYFLFGRKYGQSAASRGTGDSASSAGLKTSMGVNIGKRIG
jgi:uncharacterized membrane protein YdjX (TVP38/TMEM64 family)